MRPALALDLSNVLFTSAADATSGKAAATVGAGLVSVGETTGTVKFTMQDESQTLTVVATNEQSVQTGTTLQFNYSAALQRACAHACAGKCWDRNRERIRRRGRPWTPSCQDRRQGGDLHGGWQHGILVLLSV